MGVLGVQKPHRALSPVHINTWCVRLEAFMRKMEWLLGGVAKTVPGLFSGPHHMAALTQWPCPAARPDLGPRPRPREAPPDTERQCPPPHATHCLSGGQGNAWMWGLSNASSLLSPLPITLPQPAVCILKPLQMTPVLPPRLPPRVPEGSEPSGPERFPLHGGFHTLTRGRPEPGTPAPSSCCCPLTNGRRQPGGLHGGAGEGPLRRGGVQHGVIYFGVNSGVELAENIPDPESNHLPL